MSDEKPSISPQMALIYVMVMMSAADSAMTDNEMKKIGNIITNLPVFQDFDAGRLVSVAEECAAILGQEGGFDAVLDLIDDALPEHLRETAYAVAVEVAAADLDVHEEELRLLQVLRTTLNVERLSAAAIERGARARHALV